MPESLTAQELTDLIERVFRPRQGEEKLALLADLPDAKVADRPGWEDRRRLALEWLSSLRQAQQLQGWEIQLFFYRNVRNNNADLPEGCWRHPGNGLPGSADELDEAQQIPFESVFRQYPILMVLSEFSATAPLKKASARYGFRAASMPGFSRQMVPALRLDFDEIHRRVEMLARLLDRSVQAKAEFLVQGFGPASLLLDLRHRKGSASSGLIRDPGTAWNLPSGEAYIVPYEGEIEGDPSQSEGLLPVQFSNEAVLYRIQSNRAAAVESSGKESQREAALLEREPAYGNLAELGLGVLAGMGIEPVGSTLLDEKLGLHIAFGRSDHFGGQVGPSDFSSAEAVVHIDRIYLPQIQPLVKVVRAELVTESGEGVELVRDDEFVYGF